MKDPHKTKKIVKNKAGAVALKEVEQQKLQLSVANELLKEAYKELSWLAGTDAIQTKIAMYLQQHKLK